jgi:hypothetical protein
VTLVLKPRQNALLLNPRLRSASDVSDYTRRVCMGIR